MSANEVWRSAFSAVKLTHHQWPSYLPRKGMKEMRGERAGLDQLKCWLGWEELGSKQF